MNRINPVTFTRSEPKKVNKRVIILRPCPDILTRKSVLTYGYKLDIKIVGGLSTDTIHNETEYITTIYDQIEP